MTIAEANNLGEKLKKKLEAESFEVYSPEDIGRPYVLILKYKKHEAIHSISTFSKLRNTRYFVDTQNECLNINIML